MDGVNGTIDAMMKGNDDKDTSHDVKDKQTSSNTQKSSQVTY